MKFSTPIKLLIKLLCLSSLIVLAIGLPAILGINVSDPIYAAWILFLIAYVIFTLIVMVGL